MIVLRYYIGTVVHPPQPYLSHRLTRPNSTRGVCFTVVQTVARRLVDQFHVLGSAGFVRDPVPLDYTDRSAQTDHESVVLVLDRYDESHVVVAVCGIQEKNRFIEEEEEEEGQKTVSQRPQTL